MSGIRGRVTGVELWGTVSNDEGLEIPVARSDGVDVCGGEETSVDLPPGNCTKGARDADEAVDRAVHEAAGNVPCCVVEVCGQGAHLVECLGWEQRGHEVGLELDEKVFPQ